MRFARIDYALFTAALIGLLLLLVGLVGHAHAQPYITKSAPPTMTTTPVRVGGYIINSGSHKIAKAPGSAATVSDKFFVGDSTIQSIEFAVIATSSVSLVVTPQASVDGIHFFVPPSSSASSFTVSTGAPTYFGDTLTLAPFRWYRVTLSSDATKPVTYVDGNVVKQ